MKPMSVVFLNTFIQCLKCLKNKTFPFEKKTKFMCILKSNLDYSYQPASSSVFVTVPFIFFVKKKNNNVFEF